MSKSDKITGIIIILVVIALFKGCLGYQTQYDKDAASLGDKLKSSSFDYNRLNDGEKKIYKEFLEWEIKQMQK